MNIRKTLTFAASFLIACAGVAGIRAWANTAAAKTDTAPAAAVETIQTLPAITVRPTREQLDALRHHAPEAAQSGNGAGMAGGGIALDMPYYSFGMKATRASKG
ncbi:MAG: hypothetical protein ABI132_00725 [Rhodanobacteraceae bacterium]